MDIHLAQRSRASIDFLVSLARCGAKIEPLVARDIEALGISEDDLADDIAERHEQLETALASSRALRIKDLAGEWSSTRHGLIAREAFEEIRGDLEPQMASLADGPTRIVVLPHFTPPEYLDGVWIHRTHGGWDGHEHQGLIHAEMIHKRYLTATFGAGMFNVRRAVLDNLPRRDYKNIFEMGVSSGYHTLGIAEAFPHAKISGCDVSRAMLEQAQRAANERGLAWTLYVARGEDTRLAAGSFDLVSSFIVLHELPPDVNRAVFEEAFRLLEPGGAVIMTDVPPSWSQDKFTAWRYDRAAGRSGEPFWRAAGLLDTAQIARECGFVNVRAFKEPTGGNYWVTLGEKP